MRAQFSVRWTCFALPIMLSPILLRAQTPDTFITSGPSGTIDYSNPSFTFTASEPGCTFTAQMDGGGYAPVSSPKAYSGLADGTHTFQVRATDASNNTDPTPASLTFVVDTIAPSTSITAGPSGLINNSNPSFSFTSPDGTATFEVQMDGGGYTAATSPKSYSGLSDGTHTFQVRAVDPAGNIGAPASRSFTLDTTPPDTTITGGPSGFTSSSTATFSFTSSEANSIFQAQLDGSGYSSASSPKTYTSLTDGAHTFQVRAIDAAGNTDATPASVTFTVDTVPPDVSITAGPSGLTSNSSPSFSFTSSDSTATFQAQMDSGAYVTVTSPKNYSSLGNGSHTFRVQAIDPAGNIAPPASRTFTVDTIPPTTTIFSSPPGVAMTNTAIFGFQSSESGSTFQVRLDGEAYFSAASPYTWTNLTGGNHTFQVRAIDPAGNIDPGPATRSWAIIPPFNGSNILTIAPLGNAQVAVTYFGDPNASYTLQQSANLLNWSTWYSSISPSNGIIQQPDTLGTAKRFYRAVASPNGSLP
jgi:large repetitive protein